MADYIDRENVKSLIKVAIEDNWDLDYTLERLKEINSADVVEHSKIDKAIAEIERLDFIRGENEIFVNKDFVLEIIKRNIGE